MACPRFRRESNRNPLGGRAAFSAYPMVAQPSRVSSAKETNSGVTLVEVLVAVTIMSLALLTYVTVIQASHNSMTDGKEFSVASQATSDEVALCQGVGFGYLANGTTTTTVSGLVNGAIQTTIGPMPSAPSNSNIKEIDMTVTWHSFKSGGLVTNTLTQSALMSNHP
jgi:prepilin-type N-terminal cleavage/methylation domain-containing protein